MAERGKRITSLAITLGLVGLNLIAFNALLGSSSVRLDLTEDGLYSITPATKRLLRSLDENVVIYGYFSERTHPKLAPLVPQIEDMLAEYEAVSRGRVEVEILDPSEDPEVEREVRDRYGVESTPFALASKYETGIVNAYFALVIRYADEYVRYGYRDLIEFEALPDGDIEVWLRNLEYDLTRGIKKAVYGFRGGAELFERVQGPVRFTALISPDTLPELFQDLPEAIRGAARELEEKGGDKFEYIELDPSSDDPAAIEAVEHFGVRPMSLSFFGDAEPFYLYGFLETETRFEQLVLTGEGITAAEIRETIENSLRRQTPGFLKTVGVVTPEPMIPPELMMQLQMQGRTPPQPPPEFEQIRELLRLDYEVRDVDLDQPVPTDVDLLLLLKPKDLDEVAVYNLDQYLMRGGRVILCSGRFEADLGGQSLSIVPVDSGLDDWLAHFGLEIEPTMVLDEQNQPMLVPDVEMTAFGARRTLRLEPYPYLVHIDRKGLVDREVAARLEAVGLYWGSPIHVDREAAGDLEVIELLRSSERSWTDADQNMPIEVIRYGYEVPEEGTESMLMGVALSGRFPSYFAGKEPPRREQPAAAGEDDSEEAGTPPAEIPLQASPETRLVVVSSSEFVSDLVAIALQTLNSGFFDENLAFVQNLIDWTTLDNDMLEIRSRDATTRRLAQVTTATEASIETASYLAVAAFLLALAAYRLWRRRNSIPVVGVQR